MNSIMLLRTFIFFSTSMQIAEKLESRRGETMVIHKLETPFSLV